MNRSYLALWGALVFMAVAGLVTALWDHPEVARGEVGAAWAQAIFSVAAIIALFVAQRMDHEKAESARQAEKSDASELQVEALLQVTAAVFVFAKTAQKHSYEMIWTEANARRRLRELESLMSFVERIDFARLRTRRDFASLMATRKMITVMEAHLGKMVEELKASRIPKMTLFDSSVAVLEKEVDYLTTQTAHRR